MKIYNKVGNRRNSHKDYVRESRNIKQYKRTLQSRGIKLRRNWRKILKSK